jgi:hypothetical protein
MDRNGCFCRLLPRPARAFPGTSAGRRPSLHFRGLLGLHSRCGLPDCSAAQGGLRHEASTRPVARPCRSSATRAYRQLSGWFLPPLVNRAVGAHDVLRALVAEQNDATLAEYAERFAARTGRRRSPSAICRALRRLDLPRKKSRSGPRSRVRSTASDAKLARTWPRRVPRGTRRSPGSRRSGWSSLTRAASTPA